ncbi:unnamed protein product [Prorocentrum cordatum]|uniref:Glycosyltransferase 2-like domain-containing protein n=1 Tax=Prorocentrum cordatum TaxID=2364126 RepID=A0ABN9WL71_9DINO|nr:unnamed protein product [Polarella glacialis]
MEASGVRRRGQSSATIAEEQPSPAVSSKPPWSPAPAATKGSPCPSPYPCSGDGDQAAGPHIRISLSDPGMLQSVCCWIPGLLIFPPMLVIIFCAFFAQDVMMWIAAVLSVWTVIYSGNLSISCVLGAWRMRRDVDVDWQAKLEKVQAEAPEASAFMHVVFLPNYKEDEEMMQQTLENLGRSALARKNMHVVLCMEDREGEAARQKARNLIDASRHLFADIGATFHPANLPGDVAGKSSNTQWGYRQALQRLAPQLSNHDASKVFLTVSDADTLFHPQYFSAMTYQGLTMSAHERAWSIWQSPILLLRNLFSTPGPTRLSGYATIIFELAGLANQKFSPHFSYSSYSVTLAMASHRFVDGWDRDVIAEDHHMFCKCYFASIWEQLDALRTGIGLQPSATECAASRVRLRPVFLPAISYLVESDGWLASIHARFVQARRHAQGLAELSYIFLQQAHLLMSGGSRHIASATHVKTWNIAGKMASVHILANMHSLSLILTTILLAVQTLRWLVSQSPQELLSLWSTRGAEGLWSLQSFAGLKWALFAIFGPVPPLSMLMSTTTYIVVRDALEGKLSRDPAHPKELPSLQGSVDGGMGRLQQLKLYLMVQNDYLSGAFITLFAYGLVPATMAAWSLMTRGTGFEYVVGTKPKETAA